MSVMTVAGLWHGAGWTFVVWGAVHGTYLCASRFMPTRRLQALIPVPTRYRAPVYEGLAIFVFFHLTVLAWIPFRAPDLATAFHMVLQAFQFRGLDPWISQAELVVAVGVSMVCTSWNG